MSGVDLARVLELHEEATRRRELKPCSEVNPLVDCVLVVDHSGGHEPRTGASQDSLIRWRLCYDQLDRYAAVVALVPALVEEIERLREELAKR